ncbi:hypothetical protein DFH09DRAFT_1083562 [Mycena vulgaris]|nr:hypothetical protein DFH09DRAFT_1083562 [Mycena vulgaris]
MLAEDEHARNQRLCQFRLARLGTEEMVSPILRGKLVDIPQDQRSRADRNTWLLDKNFDEWKRLTSGSARFEAEEQGMYDKWYWDVAPGAGIPGGGRGGMATHKINVNPIERAGRIAERGETGGPAMTSPDEARGVFNRVNILQKCPHYPPLTLPLIMIPIHVPPPSLRLRPLPRALPPLYSANIEQHSLRAMCTRAELIRAEEEQRQHNEPCDNCGLEVCPWGYVEYWDTRGFTMPLSPICKACDVHVRAGTEPPPCTCPPGARACEKTDSGCLLHVVPAFYRVPDGVPRLVAPYIESFYWVGESEPDAATRVMRADECAILGWQLTQESRYSECSLLSLRAPVREGMARSGLLPPGMLPYGSPEAGVERRQVRKTVKESAAEAEARFMNYTNI